MAFVMPHQPRYRDRTLPIYYLLGDRLVLRSRPTQVHDPRTSAQLRQRLRMQVASRFLRGFRPMVAEGFAPEELDNLRRVGAYQQALGRLLRGALVETPEGVGIDAARVLLSEGYGAPLGAVRARGAGRVAPAAARLGGGAAGRVGGAPGRRGEGPVRLRALRGDRGHGHHHRGCHPREHDAVWRDAARHVATNNLHAYLPIRSGGPAGRPAAPGAAQTALRSGVPPPPAGGHLLRAATTMRGHIDSRGEDGRGCGSAGRL